MGLVDVDLSNKNSGNENSKISFGEQVGNTNTKESFRKRKDYKRSQHHFIPRESRSSRPGRKITRRRENLQFLLSLVDGFDFDETGEVDLCDLIGETASAFTELFLDEEKMTIWQAFANSTEDDQNDFLNKPSKFEDENWLDDFEIIELPMEDISEENCLERCKCAFLKISCKLRHFLNRRHVPKGDLLKIEEELIEFFNTNPELIYKVKLTCSFQRMLTHAVSQYLDLESKTFNYKKGAKEVQVESKSQQFCHPGMMLAEYLDQHKL